MELKDILEFHEQYNAEQEHQKICDYLHQDLYLIKNIAYGDSFHQLYNEFGIISAVTQIAHKFNRLKTQSKHYEEIKDVFPANAIDVQDIKDTLLDLANYCILTVMEIEKEQLNNSFSKESKENQNGLESKEKK